MVCKFCTVCSLENMYISAIVEEQWYNSIIGFRCEQLMRYLVIIHLIKVEENNYMEII